MCEFLGKTLRLSRSIDLEDIIAGFTLQSKCIQAYKNDQGHQRSQLHENF